MKFVVTGSSGFIASNLIRELSLRDISCLALSRQNNSSFPSSAVKTLSVDYSDLSLLRKLFSGCEYIVHLAGLAHQHRVTTPNIDSHFKAANVDVLSNVALAASDVGVKKLVLISSIGVLGEYTTTEPFSDFTYPKPVSPYAISKLHAEIALKTISERTSIPYLILRPPLVYGENCPGNLARLIKLTRIAPFIPLGSLHSRRSFISVRHLVDMIIKSALSDSIFNDHYVLSDSVDLSLPDVLLSLLRGLGKSHRSLIKVNPRALSFAAHVVGKHRAYNQLASDLVIDSSRFRRAANWQPFTDPYTELERTARSFRL